MDAKKERIDRILAESERLRGVVESAADELREFSRNLLDAARILSAEVTDQSGTGAGDDERT